MKKAKTQGGKKMIENKELIIQQADRVHEELTELVYQIKCLEDHQRGTLENVINEIGLPDLEELEYQFGRLAEMADKIEVIGGYQVWINENHNLNIIAQNRHYDFELRMELVFERLMEIIDQRQTAKNIFKWYIDTAY